MTSDAGMTRLAILCLYLCTAGPAAADFIRSNLRFTLYHELGHAVIDQLSLPVFGTEETAADSFGIVLADRLHPEEEMQVILTDMTALSRAEAVERIFDPWDQYMPDAQRLARAICLAYGLNPAERLPLARALGMPASAADACVEDATQVRAAWAPVMERLRPKPGATPTESLRPGRHGKALRLLGQDIERVNEAIVLPRFVPVTNVACGEDNAYYFHIDERIEFCSEMVEALSARGLR